MKSYITAAFIALMLPLSGFSNNSIAQASGFSDTMLLTLMLGFIALLLVIIKALAKSIEGISKGSAESKSNGNGGKITALAILSILGSTNLQAAENATSTSSFVMSDSLFWLLLSLIVFLAIIVGVLFKSLLTLIKLEHGVEEEEEVEEESIFRSIGLTDNVPLEEEATVMMDHEYDGIRELDNNLPPWWKYMFYATIIFAVVYLIRFHITGHGKLSHEEYYAQMEEAQLQKAEFMANAEDLITEDNVTYLVDETAISKGAAIYKGNCATCHGQLGEGGAGPNLTDEYWIHGGNIKSVFKTIKYGVPAKGMIAWQTQFNPSQMQEVASYVLSLQGTNPPNGKAPEGELFVEEEKPTEEVEETTEEAEEKTEEESTE
tara:strand:+ start:891 stop:2018 length:1128 start_codon:yes stop_codon:yes gene_type:complete